MSNLPLLSVKNLSLHFGKNPVLKNVSFDLSSGSLAGLLGASGCGKTTLLRCIAGFQGDFQGQIFFKGEDLSQVPPHKRGVGFVFQDLSLFPHMSVKENIGFGLCDLNGSEKSQRISELLDIFGLTSLGLRFPHELSGGQKQRVALARSMAPQPALILMDEPFSGLDTSLKRHLLGELKSILQEQGQTLLMVTHSQEELFQLADEGGVLIDGTLHQWSKVGQIYSCPQTTEVALAIGQGSLLEVECGEGGGQTSFGWISWTSFLGSEGLNEESLSTHSTEKLSVAVTPQSESLPMDLMEESSVETPFHRKNKKANSVKKIFIRPEQVCVSGESKETGLFIKSIQNYGSHQLVEIISRSPLAGSIQGGAPDKDEHKHEDKVRNRQDSGPQNLDETVTETLWARVEKSQKLEIQQSVRIGWRDLDTPVLFESYD